MPTDTWRRSLSPLEMCATPNCWTILADTVPLPDAGAPSITALRTGAARYVVIATMRDSTTAILLRWSTEECDGKPHDLDPTLSASPLPLCRRYCYRADFEARGDQLTAMWRDVSWRNRCRCFVIVIAQAHHRRWCTRCIFFPYMHV